MAKVVGIDFGTSNSAVSSFLNGKNQVLADNKGNVLTPSVVSFGKNNQVLVGHDAKAQALKNPKRTIYSIKRLIGRKFYADDIKKAQVLLPYEIVEDEGQNVQVRVDDKTHSPQEIGAFIFKHLKSVAENALQDNVEKAVVTVPAYFNDNQRKATKEACEIAGLEVIRMINEPTAAALAYGFGKDFDETIVVYDLGGGTFDLSILRLQEKVFEVIATAGDTFLGGDDFDDRIIDLMADDFLKKTKIDLRSMPQALPLLRTNAEKTKRRLSYAERSDVYIPGIIKNGEENVDLHFSLSREELRDQTKDLIQKTFSVCDEALASAGLRPSEVKAVILVGGPTKMPLIADAVETYFGKKPLNEMNPDEVVSMGAAIQAETLAGSQKENLSLLIDVTPLDLGIATVDGFTETLIEKNSPIPSEVTKAFSTISDNQDRVDIRIFQGKNRREDDSYLLGEFSLLGFEKKKAGEVTIDITFSINTDGIVQVSAVDQETGVAQKVEVKLSAALGKDSVAASSEKAKSYKQVKLKDQWEGASKILAYRCGESAMNSEYIEGFVKNFHPENPELKVFSENHNEHEKIYKKDQFAWICLINDFANIPRYVNALVKKPEKIEEKPENQLYEFKLINGESLFAQADLPHSNSSGFWVTPYFAQDRLAGKVYIYSSKLKEASPLPNSALGPSAEG